MRTFSLPFLKSFLIEQPNPSTLILRRKDRHLQGMSPRGRNTQRPIGEQQQMSSSLAQTILGTKACAWVDSDAAAPTYRRSRGFAVGTAIVRNGAGDYTLTLSDALDTAATGDVLLSGGCNHNAFAALAIELASATTLRTRTAVLTAVPAVTATDLDFWIKIEEMGPN